MELQKLTVVVPCYNEEATIQDLLGRLAALTSEKVTYEVIVVDDGSRDRTYELAVEAAAGRPGWMVLRHDRNRGKGAAVRTGFSSATGAAVIVQDADTEYNPADIPALVDAYLEQGGASAVYGSRNLRCNRYSCWSYYVGGRALTAFANLLYHLRLTDAFTGYKLMPTHQVRRMDLQSRRFEFCAEVTAKLTRLGVPIVEVPIRYESRGFDQGKKIRASDGLVMLATFLRWRLWRPADEWNWLDRLLSRWRMRRALTHLKPGDRILDIGCGSQQTLWRLVSRLGVEYVGLDPHLLRTEKHGAAEFGPLDMRTNRWPVSDASFDKLAAFAVIEHLDQPASFVAEARRVLKPGGRVILTTPSVSAKPVLEALARLRLVNAAEIAEHKHYFSRDELSALFLDAGFRVISQRHFQFGFNQILVAEKPAD